MFSLARQAYQGLPDFHPIVNFSRAIGLILCRCQPGSTYRPLGVLGARFLPRGTSNVARGARASPLPGVAPAGRETAMRDGRCLRHAPWARSAMSARGRFIGACCIFARLGAISRERQIFSALRVGREKFPNGA